MPNCVSTRQRRKTHGGTCPARIVNRGPHAVECAVEIPFTFSAPEVPRWLIPGLFYGDNGYDPANVRIYPRFSPTPAGDDPFLASEWAFRSDRCASPAVFAGVEHDAFFLATDEEFSHGMSGVGFGYLAPDPENAVALLALYFPYRETPVSCAEHNPEHLLGEMTYVELGPGEELSFSFRLGAVPDEDRYGFAPVLRALHRRAAPLHAPAPWMSLPEAAELAAYGNYTWFYDPAEHVLVETCGFDKYFARARGLPGYFDRPNMHISWISGIAYAHALARWGEENARPEYLEAGNSVIERICREGGAPCGALWGHWKRDKEGGPGWDGGWNPDPAWLHARTLGEACSFLCDAILWEESRGRRRPLWRRSLASSLDFVVGAQRFDGNLGTYYHGETGEVVEWKGTAGLALIPALVKAAALSPRLGRTPARYLQAAERAGCYYRRFVQEARFFGGCEDVSLSPCSEDGYNALMAYTALYQALRTPQFLEDACRSAEWMLTFRWTYNTRFPEHSFLAKYDFRTVGGDVASPPNQHLHNYGLIATVPLLRLWMWTGDPHYLDRARDHLNYALQMIAREDGDLNARRGMMSEQWYHTEWWQPKGAMLQLAHVWCAGFLTLTEQALRDLQKEASPRIRSTLRQLGARDAAGEL